MEVVLSNNWGSILTLRVPLTRLLCRAELSPEHSIVEASAFVTSR